MVNTSNIIFLLKISYLKLGYHRKVMGLYFFSISKKINFLSNFFKFLKCLWPIDPKPIIKKFISIIPSSKIFYII